MKSTKYRNSKGILKGAFIHEVKSNGELYLRPMFIPFLGAEKTPEDVVKRLKKLNPCREYVPAQNQEIYAL